MCPVRMYSIVCGDMTPPTHTTQSFALSLYRKWALKGKENLTSVTTRLSQACSCALQECLACHSSPVHQLTRAKYFKQYPIRVYLMNDGVPSPFRPANSFSICPLLCPSMPCSCATVLQTTFSSLVSTSRRY